MYWNKSDTNHCTVVAVGFKEVGVDIEYMRYRRFEDISRRYFHKDEITDNMHTFYELWCKNCLLYTSPSPRDRQKSRMPSSA